MKIKIQLVVISLLFSLACSGQELQFKDILIKGSSQEILQQIERKYPSDIQYKDKNGIVLSGSYLSQSVLYIIHFREDSQIKSIDIKFPKYYDWKSLENNYHEIKTKLSSIYGKPIYQEEYFKGTPSKMLYYDYTIDNKCLYSAEFKDKRTNSYLRLFIKAFSDRTTSVVVRYTKGEWSRRKFQSIMSDLEESESQSQHQSSTENRTRNVRGAGGYETFDLSGRSLGASGLPVPVYNVQDEGRVVVNIVVNAAGWVIGTSINERTNTVNPQLRRAAEMAARKAHFNTVKDAEDQMGTITYYFKLK